MSLISASGQKKPSENIWSLCVLRSLPGVCEPNSGLTAACWTWSLNKFHIQISWKLGLQRAAMLGWPNCLGKNEPFKAAGSSSVNDLPKLHTSNTLSATFLSSVIQGKDLYSVLYSLNVIYVDLYRYTFIIFCPLLSSVCFYETATELSWTGSTSGRKAHWPSAPGLRGKAIETSKLSVFHGFFHVRWCEKKFAEWVNFMHFCFSKTSSEIYSAFRQQQKLGELHKE